MHIYGSEAGQSHPIPYLVLSPTTVSIHLIDFK